MHWYPHFWRHRDQSPGICTGCVPSRLSVRRACFCFFYKIHNLQWHHCNTVELRKWFSLRYDLLLSFSEDGNISCRPVSAWWPQWWKLHGHLCLWNFNHTCTRLRGCRCAQFLSLVRRLRLSTKIPSQGARFNPAPSGLAKTRMSRCTNKVEKTRVSCAESTVSSFRIMIFIMRECRWEKVCAIFRMPARARPSLHFSPRV